MLAVRYVRSVPRWLAARYGASRWPRLLDSPLSPVRLEEVDPPALPGPAWVRVRPLLAGICGSDLATVTAQGSTYFSPFVSTPFVPGHEVVGVVEETGSEARRTAVGERVVIHPPLHCAVRGLVDRCVACRAGDTAHCRNVTAGDLSAGIQTGYCRDTGGGWSSSLVAHEIQLRAVPDGVPDEAAVLIEPYSCCLHAVERAGDLDPAWTALVIGCGSIGLLTIVALRASGFGGRLVAVAKYPHQAEAAQKLGADEIVPPGNRPALGGAVGATLHEPELGPPSAVGGADVAFDCVGTGATLDDAIRFTRPRGSVIVVGMPGLPDGIDWTAMWHKELDVRGSYTCPDETFGRAVRDVSAAGGRLAPLVTGRFPLEAYGDALRTALDAGRLGHVKVVFEPR
ncbi:MAG TPA: zinc-binding dehydrogenase [Gemmatimonadota bacterium]|nr:zinc-binding dehydrogenase [Gemmatimonadota bacterium]